MGYHSFMFSVLLGSRHYGPAAGDGDTERASGCPSGHTVSQQGADNRGVVSSAKMRAPHDHTQGAFSLGVRLGNLALKRALGPHCGRKKRRGEKECAGQTRRNPAGLGSSFTEQGHPSMFCRSVWGIWRQVEARMVKTGESRVDEEKKSM